VTRLFLGHFQFLVILRLVRVDLGGLDVQALGDQIVDLLGVGGIPGLVGHDKPAALSLDLDGVVAVTHRNAVDIGRVQALDQIGRTRDPRSSPARQTRLNRRPENHHRRHHGQYAKFLVTHYHDS